MAQDGRRHAGSGVLFVTIQHALAELGFMIVACAALAIAVPALCAAVSYLLRR
jgi:hypothetical protein